MALILVLLLLAQSADDLYRRGVILLKLVRGGEEIPFVRSTILDRGDLLRISGAREDVERAGKVLGYVEQPSHATDVVFVGLGIVIGGLIGALTVKVGGLPLSLNSVPGISASLGRPSTCVVSSAMQDGIRPRARARPTGMMTTANSISNVTRWWRERPRHAVAAKLHRAKSNIPGALVELTQAIDEYGAGGAGGAAVAYVEMAEAERARGARADVLKDLFTKALEKDPASCEALWGAAKVDLDQGRLAEDGKRRLEMYARVCPREPHAAEAARLAK